VNLGKGEEAALAAAIKATLQEPRKKPLSLPHLSAEVLADEYVSLYRRLIPFDVPLQDADRSASMLGGTPERRQYDGISGTGSQNRRGERGYI
jgi:hypothetical protein